MYEQMSDVKKDLLKEVTNKLIATNFVVREKNRDLYDNIRKIEPELHAFFRMIGWQLIVDHRHDCVFVQAEQTMLRKNLSKEESIWLLVLRLLYEQKRQELSISKEILVSLHDIRLKYETFHLEWPKKTKIEELSRVTSKYQLTDKLEIAENDDDSYIRLHHTLQYVLDNDGMKVINEKLQKLSVKKEMLIHETTEEDSTY